MAKKNKKVHTFLIGFTNMDSRDTITCVINKGPKNTVDVNKTSIIAGEEARKLYDTIARLSAKNFKKN